MDIKDLSFFRGLSEEELSVVKECMREKFFRKGQSLFIEGNSCERIFFVKSGRVKVFRLGTTGREQTLQTLGPGDTCACNPGNTEWHCSSSAEALSDTTVWFLSRDHYVNLLKTNSKLAYSLNSLFAERLQCFGALIEDISLKDTKKRLVKFLLTSPYDDGKNVSVSFTREELAQRLGMTRETLTRQLQDLKNKKLIDVTPKKIILLNKEALRDLL